MGAEISPVYAPNDSAWTFWAPTADAAAGQGLADRLEAHVRRTHDARNAGHARRRGDVAGQRAGIGRRRVHLPVAGDDHRTHRLAHSTILVTPRRPGVVPRCRSFAVRAGPARGTVRPLPRVQPGWPRGRVAGQPPTRRTRGGRPAQPAASAPARRCRPAGGARPPTRPAQVGVLGVDDTVQMALERTADQARFDLERGRRRAQPAQQVE